MALAVCAGLANGATIDVPFVRQVRRGCGAAAVAMVMQYWIRQTPGMDAATGGSEGVERFLRPTADGLSGDSLRVYFEAHGFSAFVFNGEISDLRKHIEKGRPVIVCLRPGGGNGELHFVVLSGFTDGEAIMNDPAGGKSVHQPLSAFLREWKSTGGWALLAVPRATK